MTESDKSNVIDNLKNFENTLSVFEEEIEREIRGFGIKFFFGSSDSRMYKLATKLARLNSIRKLSKEDRDYFRLERNFRWDKLERELASDSSLEFYFGISKGTFSELDLCGI